MIERVFGNLTHSTVSTSQLIQPLQLLPRTAVLAHQHTCFVLGAGHVDGWIPVEEIARLVVDLVDLYGHDGPIFHTIFTLVFDLRKKIWKDIGGWDKLTEGCALNQSSSIRPDLRSQRRLCVPPYHVHRLAQADSGA